MLNEQAARPWTVGDGFDELGVREGQSLFLVIG